MKHGIGIITTGSRTLSGNYLSFLSLPTFLFVHTDHTRRGPGYGRNQCIKNLYDAGCDFITLFDDDCYPIHADWQDFIIGGMEQNNIEFLTYTYPFEDPIYTQGPLIVSGPETNSGVFFTITRKIVDVVGYLNPNYQKYGWEEHGYFARIRKSGINPVSDGDISLLGIEKYILPEDYHPTVSHNPTANYSVHEKQKLVALNKPVFDAEVASDQVYCPYTK